MTGQPLVYPALYGRLDLGFARLNGAGLGNCLFTYAHAVAIAWQNGAGVVAPAWRTVALNAKLRGRQYGDLIGPHPDEIAGARKAALLARDARRAPRLVATAAEMPRLGGGLTIVSAPFVFDGLHPHRKPLCERLLGALRVPHRAAWGTGDYAAMHVRLGDFEAASEAMLDAGDRTSLRIPLDWYVAVAERLRRARPGLPLRVFSDGGDDDLMPLLRVAGVVRHRSASDVDDLLAMAGARLFVGSHSTFSQWAAFLGDMPSLWRDRRVRPDRPTSDDTPLFYVDRDLGGFPDDAALAGAR